MHPKHRRRQQHPTSSCLSRASRTASSPRNRVSKPAPILAAARVPVVFAPGGVVWYLYHARVPGALTPTPCATGYDEHDRASVQPGPRRAAPRGSSQPFRRCTPQVPVPSPERPASCFLPLALNVRGRVCGCDHVPVGQGGQSVVRSDVRWASLLGLSSMRRCCVHPCRARDVCVGGDI